MTPRLIIVSNRVAIPKLGTSQLTGGLAIVIKAALRRRSGIWFGWSGNISETETTEPYIIKHKNITYIVIDLLKNDFNKYYNGLANQVLWPIMHYRVDLQKYSQADHSGYSHVNEIFAKNLSNLLRDDDIIWVHDYHLMLLAKELRMQGHSNPIGFFLHTPCAPLDILCTLPRHEEIIGALTYYDLIGFQTNNDRDNFANYLLTLPDVKQKSNFTFDILNGHQTQIGTFPAAIETVTYARLARNNINSKFNNKIKKSLNDQRLIIGVDRLDYSKGIINRINSFSHFLEVNPEWRSRVSFLQITPRSRSDIENYAEVEDEVTALISKVNGRYGEASWTPIRYINRIHSRADLSGIYRMANVALVTPLRDGMNLVAKEYVAAQDEENPGVLVLSEFAGAALELTGAIIVNPHDHERVALALKQALEMPLDERCRRYELMFKHLLVHNVDEWVENYLLALADSQQRPSFLSEIRTFLGI